MATPADVIRCARTYVGYTGNQFWELYQSRYGSRSTDWCAAFLRVVGDDAGVDLYAGKPSNWVPTVRDGYIDAKRYYTSGPQVGDVFFVSNSSPGKTAQKDIGSHTGIIGGVNGDALLTLEGNVGNVCKEMNWRRWSDLNIIGVGRPLYTPTGWHASRGYLTDSQIKDNALLIYNFFAALGWTVEAVAGMLANMEKESGINPGAIEGHRETPPADWSGIGYGLVQWTPGTKIWRDEPAAIDSGPGQCARIQKELVTEPAKYGQWISTKLYPITGAEFTKLTNAATAASAFYHNYERPYVFFTEAERRQKAIQWAEWLSGQPGPGPGPGPIRLKKSGMPLWMYLLGGEHNARY